MYQEYQESSKNLVECLGLRNEPIAFKICHDESEIPADAYRPYRDDGIHYAFCQAMTIVKEQGKKIALGKEDHWCWKPLIGFGHVKVEKGSDAYNICLHNNGIMDLKKSAENFDTFPVLPYGSCAAVVMCPVSKMDFTPDLVLVYCDKNTQIRWLFGGIKRLTGRRVISEFDYIDSCIWSTVPAYLANDYRVTFPDPGETERALCPEDEVILSIPGKDFNDVSYHVCLKAKQKASRPTKNIAMVPDFPRPEFYNKLFEIWGLQTGEVTWNESQRGYTFPEDKKDHE